MLQLALLLPLLPLLLLPLLLLLLLLLWYPAAATGCCPFCWPRLLPLLLPLLLPVLLLLLMIQLRYCIPPDPPLGAGAIIQPLSVCVPPRFLNGNPSAITAFANRD